MMPDFFNLSYLSTGSDVQRKGLEAIKDLGIMETLKHHQPVLAGTLPLDIFIEGSDLDILSCCEDHSEFEKVIQSNYGMLEGFRQRRMIIKGIHSAVAGFRSGGFEFEVFAQIIPTQKQTAYRHLVNEFLILRKEGSEFKKKIIALKKQGLKTEPAFAKLLNLAGDPYEAMLNTPLS